jgi:hypothetical protein
MRAVIKEGLLIVVPETAEELSAVGLPRHASGSLVILGFCGVLSRT